MMMNDEQKLAPSGFAYTPSIVPNYTANRRGARIDTRPATDCPWRWATHEGPMLCLVHTHPPTERKGGRVPDSDEKPNFEAQQTTTTTPKHTCLDCNGNESASGTVPQATVMVRPTSYQFFWWPLVRSFSEINDLKLRSRFRMQAKSKISHVRAGRARTCR